MIKKNLLLHNLSDIDNGASDGKSIMDFKLKSMPSVEFDQMTDLSSISRANRAYTSILKEKFERDTPSYAKVNRFGTAPLLSTLSIEQNFIQQQRSSHQITIKQTVFCAANKELI